MPSSSALSCTLAAIFFLSAVSVCGALITLQQPLLLRRTGLVSCRLSVWEDLSVNLYDQQLFLSSMVESQLKTASLTSCGLLYAAGLLTSFSPCAISLLPLTLAYLGSADDVVAPTASNSEPATKEKRLLIKSIFYAAGLAFTFAAFGLGSALLGQLFGSSATSTSLGKNFPTFLTASVSLVMGLNLLDIVKVSFPSFAENSSLQFANKLPESAQAFVLGSSSTLIASPCSSPVLTSLLAFVASSGRPSLGALFLFIFSLGYATPIVAAASLSGFANSMYSSRGVPWVNNALASLLIAYGTYSALDVFFTAK